MGCYHGLPGGDLVPTPITFPETNDPNSGDYTVYIVSQTDELEVNVRRVAAILGTFNSFLRRAHGRPGENGYVVEYRHDDSATLAAGFAIGGIRFAVKNEPPNF